MNNIEILNKKFKLIHYDMQFIKNTKIYVLLGINNILYDFYSDAKKRIIEDYKKDKMDESQS